VWTATFYLQGAASQWYYRWEKNHGVPDWKTFVDGVHKRFAPHLRSNPLGELSHCRRTGSVDEYVDQFLKLLARCEDVSETQQIDLFTAGLLQPMCTDVEMHSPATLEDAMALTCSYERRLQITNDIARGPARPAKAAATPSSTPSTASNQAKPSAPSARPRRLSPEEMAQRRLEGLCFNCPANFPRNTSSNVPCGASTSWIWKTTTTAPPRPSTAVGTL